MAKNKPVSRVEQMGSEEVYEATSEPPILTMEDQGVILKFVVQPSLPIHVSLVMIDDNNEQVGVANIPLNRFAPNFTPERIMTPQKAFWKRQEELENLSTIETVGS